jgi:hypothetical protein
MNWPGRYRISWVNDTAWMMLAHLAGLAGLYVIWTCLIRINNCYFFYEYVLKFTPFLLQAHPADWFDTWAAGDPRPRIVTILAEVINLRVRGAVSQVTLLPPALSINWIVYPLVCIALYRAARQVSGQRLTALAVALLWGLSPPALDSLVVCYVPAKSLMNLWFALALLAGANLQAAQEELRFNPAASRRVRSNLLLLAATVLFALLTDETAAVIVACVPVIYYRCFFPTGWNFQKVAGAWTALLAPLVIFAGITFILYPTVNKITGQVSLDFIKMVLHGPAVAYLGSPTTGTVSSSHLANWAANFQPLGTAFTMITAHLLPDRQVATFWTSGNPITPAMWPIQETAEVFLFMAVSVALAATAPPPRRRFVAAVAVAMVCLIGVYAVLLIPLAPAITEVNYYGSLSSIPYVLLVGFVFSDLGPRRWQRGLAVLAVVFFAALELLGYSHTAERNRTVFSNPVDFSSRAREIPWTYSDLREIRQGVNAGEFARVARLYPYPSRAFCYAFELEANREHRAGQPIDFVPTERADSLYGMLLHLHVVKGLGPAIVSTEPNLAVRLARGERALDRKALAALVTDTAWHGANDECAFSWSYADGTFVERYWLPLVMRVWRQQGTVRVTDEGSLRLEGNRTGIQNLRVVAIEGAYLAFDETGRCVFRFQLIPKIEL